MAEELRLLSPNSFNATHCSGQTRRLLFAMLDAVWAGRAELLRDLLSYKSLSHVHWCPTHIAVEKSPRPGGMSGLVFSPLEATASVSRWQDVPSKKDPGQATERLLRPG